MPEPYYKQRDGLVIFCFLKWGDYTHEFEETYKFAS